RKISRVRRSGGNVESAMSGVTLRGTEKRLAIEVSTAGDRDWARIGRIFSGAQQWSVGHPAQHGDCDRSHSPGINHLPLLVSNLVWTEALRAGDRTGFNGHLRAAQDPARTGT